VLIGFDGIVKLTDFGVAEVLGQAQESGGFVRGKICYMGPELLDGRRRRPSRISTASAWCSTRC
jgi:serine/threonine protein kinase